MIDVKALQYTTPTALTRATKPFSIKGVSRNSRAALCQRSLPFSVCRCPLRKYHGQAGSNPKVRFADDPSAIWFIFPTCGSLVPSLLVWLSQLMGHLKIGGDKSSSDSKRLLVGGKQKVDTPLGPESPRKNQGTTLRPTGLRQHR